MSQDTIEAEANLREMERWRDAQRPGSKERKLYEVLVLYARRAYERALLEHESSNSVDGLDDSGTSAVLTGTSR